MSFENNVTVGGGHYTYTGNGYTQESSFNTQGNVVVGGGRMDDPLQRHLSFRVDAAFEDRVPNYSLSHFTESFRNMISSRFGTRDIVQVNSNIESPAMQERDNGRQDRATQHNIEAAKELALAFGSEMSGDHNGALEHAMHAGIEILKGESEQWGDFFNKLPDWFGIPDRDK
jgi:hypothetical protein